MTNTAEQALGLTVERIGGEQSSPAPVQDIVISTPSPTEVAPVVVSQDPPPVVTEPLKPEATPPAISFNPKEVFGDEFDSVDKVKEAVVKSRELGAKVAEYEKKIAESKIEDPYLQSLVEWTKQGKDKTLHDMVYYSDPAKMSHEQKVALKLQLETGISSDKALKIVAHQYKLGEDFDESDPDVEIARTLLEVESLKADKEINQWRAKAQEPVAEFDYAGQVKSWEGHIESTLNELKEISLDGTNYSVPKEVIDSTINHLRSVLGSEGIEMDARDPEQIKIIKGIASDHIKAKSFDTAFTYFRNEWEKAKIKEQANVPVQNGTPPIVVGKGTHDWMKTAQPTNF